MLRKLLACLVLLTGLAAAGAPARAEVAAVMASQVEASAKREGVGAGQVAPRATLAEAHQMPSDAVGELSGREEYVAISSVYLRIDRAHE